MLINLGDIADSLLASAVAAFAGMVTRPHWSRRTATELDITGWADTLLLVRSGMRDIRPELPEMTDGDARALAAALRADESQAALQALLAVRLTDAPEAEAAKAREAVRLALSPDRAARRGPATREIDAETGLPADAGRPASDIGLARYAWQLSDYFDRKICALVGHLEGTVGFTGLSQVRSEAYNSRIVALLGTISDMLAALRHPDRGGRAEADFLERYTRQARERHGKLQPPDFERRRRIAADKIYVNTRVYPYPETAAEAVSGARVTLLPSWPSSPLSRDPLTVMDLADCLDRTVLLGDPGGGKTTAANVLANHFASSADRSSSTRGRLPFVVTLREYAASDPPERSIVGHIEHSLETLYQCPAPLGLVRGLLFTGRAVVIFDGLDELLDTSRRRDVSERVEQFCSAYPLTPVLVTSRLVGYDQAMLGEDQFTCYRLGDFSDDEVMEYAYKWFAVQEGNSPAEAEAEASAFIKESLHAQDVRSNPLLLSLMCILYRGAGTLPRDRAAIYAKCTELLLGRWDESRRIRHELRAGHLVEPAIQHLAWWLFTCDTPKNAVTERELVDRIAIFLFERAFESEQEARTAAEEFAAFLRDRMWVLSDVGTTADGEKLYAFTHRTFLEYFAAARLAAVSDTPKALAISLLPRLLTDHGWQILAELSIQIKSRTSDRGADRFYTAALARIFPDSQPKPIEFLVSCLDVVDLSPGVVRLLTRVILDGDHIVLAEARQRLFRVHRQYATVVADQMATYIAAMAGSGDPALTVPALMLAFGPDRPAAQPRPDSFGWGDWSREQTRIHAGQIVADAVMDYRLRNLAVMHGRLSLDDALEMPGGLGALLEDPFLFTTRYACGAVGRHLMRHPDLPWARVVERRLLLMTPILDPVDPAALDGAASLGFAALSCIAAELRRGSSRTLPYPVTTPVPARFRELFRDWSNRRVEFTDIARKEERIKSRLDPLRIKRG